MYRKSLASLVCKTFVLPCRIRSSSYASIAICDDARAKLKEVYRKIHPDLFHSNTHARETNEKSFKLLQDYIANANVDVRDRGGGYGGPYDFEFYLSSTGDEKIQLTLAPPSLSSPVATRRGLNKLFKAIGVDLLDEESEWDSSTHQNMPTSLREFILRVHDVYLSDSVDSSSPEVELQTLRTALHFSRRIQVVFGEDDVRTKSTPFRIDLLRALIDIIPRCSENISGTCIGFGSGFTVDRTGTLWLRSDATSDEWLQFIQRIDIGACHDAIERKLALKKLEAQVADAAGVGSVYTDADAYASEQYEAFLQTHLLQGNDDITSTKQSRRQFPDVCVHVRVSEDDVSSVCEEAWCKDGVIVVDSRLSQDLYRTVASLAPKAAEQARKIRHHQAQIKALIKQVESKLRLRLLSKDPDLEDHKFKAGCKKLLEHAGELSPLLEGLKIRLTETNAYVSGRQCIDVCWCFKL